MAGTRQFETDIAIIGAGGAWRGAMTLEALYGVVQYGAAWYSRVE